MKGKILNLNLYCKWFDEIASGTKTVEHRQIKPYWDIRLKNRDYTEIWFTNGYGNSRPFMRVECKGININPVTNSYDILLGNILERKNWKVSKPMKQQKFDIKEHLQLIPSDPPREKRPRKGRKPVWIDEKIKGNTQGLQTELFPYKGQQLTI